MATERPLGSRSPLEDLIMPTLDGMGYALVRVELHGNMRPTLQVMAERQDGKEMTVDDCADISRALSAVMDVEDPIQEAYTLEVSSPGIDRPLTRRTDFNRFSGFETKLETTVMYEGRKRFRGMLLGLVTTDNSPECVHLREDDGTERLLPLESVRKARLILTDALIEATLKDSQH